MPESVTSVQTSGRVGKALTRVRLFTERFTVEGDCDECERECELPVLSIGFDYDGTLLSLRDPRERFFVATPRGMVEVERDRAGEARSLCLIESFGAIELDHAPELMAPFDSPADYLVQVDGNVHSWCSFSVYALPQLEALGFDVTIDPAYPYHVVDDDPPWIALISPDEQRTDWFSLELGLQVDGRRVDVLSVLLEMLEQHREGESLDSLLRLTARRRAIAVGPNRYVTLPPERLRALLQVLLELYRGERTPAGKLCFAGAQATSLTRLETVLGQGDGDRLRFEGGDALRARGRSLSLSERAESANEREFAGVQAILRPYQSDGVAWLQRLREFEAGGVLADDMGLGKTLQTIAHLATEQLAGRMTLPSLVIMPTSLVGNWARELARFAPTLRVLAYHGPKRAEQRASLTEVDVVLTTYPILNRDLEHLAELDFYYVILDEAQAIKNSRSQSAQAVKQLRATHRLCLSGTPVENNLGELWSQFDFLMPQLLGSYASFQQRFRNPIERAGCEDRLAALRERVAPFLLRRMKEHVARELPPKTELVRPVELEGAQRDLYESIRLSAHSEVRQAIRSKGVEGCAITILDALMKLRQVCCEPRLVTLPASKEVPESAKRSLFFELLVQQLEQGRRVLVFSQFTRMLAILSEGLLERGIRHVTLTGATPDRQRRVDAFQNGEVDVFLISLKAGGTGLNLTRADTVFHYDPWWNAAAQAQATDRAYRIGQTRPVFVYNLIVAGSVEQKMLALQQRKRQLADSILGGADRLSLLALSEIDDLFAPLD